MKQFEIWIGIVSLLMMLVYSSYLLYRIKLGKREGQLRERYARLAIAADLYMIEYNPASDELLLSKPCAELLRLPDRVKNYSRLLQDTTNEKLHKSLIYVETAMAPGSNSLRVKLYRKDNSLGIFRVHNQFFYNEEHQIDCVMGIFADITTEFQRQERLETRAQMDALTKVYNSGTTRRLLAEYIAENTGEEQDVLLVLDVDHFKRINDTLGHQVGDRTLQLLARTLRTVVRATDFVGRLGGDEFCIYLHKIPSYAFACEFCQRLNLAVEEQVKLPECSWSITISIGGTIIGGQDDFTGAYERADAALYKAKKKGRNTFSLEDGI